MLIIAVANVRQPGEWKHNDRKPTFFLPQVVISHFDYDVLDGKVCFNYCFLIDFVRFTLSI